MYIIFLLARYGHLKLQIWTSEQFIVILKILPKTKYFSRHPDHYQYSFIANNKDDHYNNPNYEGTCTA